MFLNLNSKDYNFKILWKSNWFTQNKFKLKIHIYEDIFIRKYITSFLFKWTKFYNFKVIGSIYLFRTFGKIYLNIYFFYPIKTNLKLNQKKKIQSKSLSNFKLTKIKPLLKHKKQLCILKFFFQLEKVLGVQVFFKFTNICNPILSNKNRLILKNINDIFNLLKFKFYIFRFKFSLPIYQNTLTFLIHLLKFKQPDSMLFANFISLILISIQKHSYFLFFLKKVLHFIQEIFKFNGIKILISGKLNGYARAQINRIQLGTLSFQSFNLPLSEGYSESFTNAGKIGIKVWIG